jgi:hypothetical protein
MTVLELERLLTCFPQDRNEIRSHIRKAKKLKRDCGCSMGAAFLVGSTFIFAVITAFVSSRLDRLSFAKYLLYGAIAVLTSTIVGKVTGIAIARIRLALLYKHLLSKHSIQEDEHVRLHQVGDSGRYHL